jgi:three-Cys-motif partner protein
MSTDDFFDQQTPDSEAKTSIVAYFFGVWLNIVGSSTRGRLGFIDLYAGPGVFLDGSKSTPVLVAETALRSSFAPRVHLLFNEMKVDLCDRLKANLAAIPEIDHLRVDPITSDEVTPDHDRFLARMRNEPALMFVDPFGYKGVTLKLFEAFVNETGFRDMIFFFNYRRITAALSNPQFASHMQRLYGTERAKRLALELDGLTGDGRERRVLESFTEALGEVGVKYFQVFEFIKRGDRLIFMSKHPKGLEVARDVMGRFSKRDEDGVPSFTFERPDETGQQTLQFPATGRPLAQLRNDLLRRFAGRRLSFDQIYLEHSPGTNFLKENYRKALADMEGNGEVSLLCESRRKSGTFGPKVVIAFPEKEG